MDEKREREVEDAIIRLQEQYNPANGVNRPEDIAQDFDRTSFELTDNLSELIRGAQKGYLVREYQVDLEKEAKALKKSGVTNEKMLGLRHDVNLAEEGRRREVENDPKWLEIRKQVEEEHAKEYEDIDKRFGQACHQLLIANGHDPDPATWEINQRQTTPVHEGAPPQEVSLREAAKRRNEKQEHNTSQNHGGSGKGFWDRLNAATKRAASPVTKDDPAKKGHDPHTR